MARLFYKNKPIIGLDIGHTGIKVMSVDPKKWLVHGYGSVDLDPLKVKESIENGSPYLSENIAQLLREKIIGNLASDRVVVGIPTARSYSRTFTLPVATEKNLEDAILLEADQYIPIPSETLYIDSQIIERNKTDITVMMSAVAQVVIDNIVTSVENAGLQVALVEPSISAVGRVLTATEDGQLPTVIVDIGPASTDIAILDRGAIRVTSGVSIGGNTFTLDIAKKLGVPLENAHQLKVLNGLNAGSRQQKIVSALELSLDKILAEVKKVMRYYAERINDNRKLEQLLIVGSGSNLPGIGEHFTSNLVMPARVANPWQRLDFGKLQEPPKQFRSRYICVAGLAGVSPEDIWR